MLNAILNFAKSSTRSPKADPAPAGVGLGLSTQPAAASSQFLPIDAVAKLIFSRSPGLRKELRPLLDDLHKLDADFARQLEAKVGNSYFAVAGKRKALLREAIAGNADFAGVPSLEEELLQAEQHRKAARWAMKRVSDQARPIAGEICRKYAEAAQATADAIEAEDKARAAEMGFPYEESIAVKTLRQAVWRASERIGLPGMPVRPRHQLPFDAAAV